MDFAVNMPLNKVSFGQVAVNILREMFKQKLNPLIFPIGDIDVRPYALEPEFKQWIEEGINRSYTNHKRKNPTFRLWHIQNSLESLSDKQLLCTFHETDTATPTEINIIRNNSKVLFSSKYSKNIFEEFGCSNIGNLPLGFDKDSFKILDKKYVENVISFGIGGKLEKRKQHHKILKLWAKKFGNQKEYVLNCAVYNPHLSPEVQENFRRAALEGKNYWNINFLPYMENNDVYNDFLNANNIFLGMSSAEGWGLPEFQSAALGKLVITLNATGYKEWITKENSILVNPNGKIPLHDGVFFKTGTPFAQGDGFDFAEDDFYKAIDIAMERFKQNPINTAGLELQKQFTWEKTVNQILSELENL